MLHGGFLYAGPKPDDHAKTLYLQPGPAPVFYAYPDHGHPAAGGVPFGISGLYDFQQKGGLLTTPGEVTVRIGPPIPPDLYAHLSVDELRNLVFRKIQALAA